MKYGVYCRGKCTVAEKKTEPNKNTDILSSACTLGRDAKPLGSLVGVRSMSSLALCAYLRPYRWLIVSCKASLVKLFLCALTVFVVDRKGIRPANNSTPAIFPRSVLGEIRWILFQHFGSGQCYLTWLCWNRILKYNSGIYYYYYYYYYYFTLDHRTTA